MASTKSFTLKVNIPDTVSPTNAAAVIDRLISAAFLKPASLVGGDDMKTVKSMQYCGCSSGIATAMMLA